MRPLKKCNRTRRHTETRAESFGGSRVAARQISDDKGAKYDAAWQDVPDGRTDCLGCLSSVSVVFAYFTHVLMRRGSFMSIRSPRLLISVLALVTSSAFVTSSARAQAQRPGKVDDAALRNAAQGKGEDWLSYGFTPQETRYTPLSQINTSNVSRLGLAWSVEVGPGGGGQEATPLVHNGVIFSTTQWSVVFAVDARTGKEKWRWDPEVNQTALCPRICCGVVQRGVAIYDGRIIAPAIDGRLFALDEETGKVLWEARVAYPQDNYTITMAPRIAKGKAIIGVSGAEYPVRGFIAAFDAKTGAQVWKFYTIPGPGDKDPGLIKAAKTWPKNIVVGGGGSVWDAISYDPDLELVYFRHGQRGTMVGRRAHVGGLRSPVCRLHRGSGCQHRAL
jgi:glucose dehydrogenase